MHAYLSILGPACLALHITHVAVLGLDTSQCIYWSQFLCFLAPAYLGICLRVIWPNFGCILVKHVHAHLDTSLLVS